MVSNWADAGPTCSRPPLIVGADGRNSPLATLAGIKPDSSANSRFRAIRTYRNVGLRRGTSSQMWLRGPETGHVFPNGGGITVIGYMATKDKLDGFRVNPCEVLEQSMAGFPDAPDLSTAEPLGNALLVKDYPNLWRRPVRGNIALVGDALMSVDPLWGQLWLRISDRGVARRYDGPMSPAGTLDRTCPAELQEACVPRTEGASLFYT